MPPHDLFRNIARSLANETVTGMASMEQVAVLKGKASHASSGLVVLSIVVPIVMVSGLIVALLLMRKGFFPNIAGKIGIRCRKSAAELQPWPGQKTRVAETSVSEKLEPTFVQRHLEMLRAWQIPTVPAQPPLPLYLGRSEAPRQPRRPTGVTFDKWEKSLRNVRPKDPAYWKKYGEEWKHVSRGGRRHKTSCACVSRTSGKHMSSAILNIQCIIRMYRFLHTVQRK